ncbi:MAG: homoserine dehydrogenase [Armatimonadota bacterium]|nr:homoserine dehydrogenase [Armatimonadota bacterium]MDR7567167.1 homoserine dehydrogenase [Armatimonadota bacterium]
MYAELVERERTGRPIRVAVVGAGGSMGQGIAWQLGHTPGFRLVAAVDIDLARARRAAELHGRPWTEPRTLSELRRALMKGQTVVAEDIRPVLDEGRNAVDVLVESTNTVAFAARVVEQALRNGIDVVLMNAEVDCLLGWWLHHLANASGAVVTSDAGDQHGVLVRMMDEIRVWGFEIVMAGNIKGFLDRYATPESIAEEARKRNLSPVMCAAYTDGTKLNIEMALVANATGLVPAKPGMLGPRARHVSDVFTLFDFWSLRNPGVVDYILGAEPGGGVFVVGYCDDPTQQAYLRYYKMGDGPFYLFYRPYHLCHLETPVAIATATLHRKPILAPLPRPVADAIAFAKTDLLPGTRIHRGIGSEHVYGLVLRHKEAEAADGVPVCLLDQEEAPVVLRRRIPRDTMLTWEDVAFEDTDLLKAHRRQRDLLRLPQMA